MKIILASTSPRRKELLTNMGVNFEIIIKETNETRNTSLPFRKQIEQISIEKAEAVFAITEGNRFVIGADTMVIVGKTFLGKPKSPEKAAEMLKFISGKKHKVVTAMCIIVQRDEEIKRYVICDVAKVYIKKLSEETINYYISTKEPLDKAGAYAIQGIGGMYVEKIKGCYNSVVGLPTPKLYEILKQEGLIN